MRIERWGLIPYDESLVRQENLVARVADGEPDTLVFCSHPPVVTLGRATPREDWAEWQGKVVEVSRGGRATYHGPHQLVIYPIVNLGRERSHLATRDVHAYLRTLGEAVADTARSFEIAAEYRHGEEPGSDRHITGVWVGERKLASIGIAVRRWVTYHGVALNVERDAKAFSGIRPCGFSPSTMISWAEVAPSPNSREQLEIAFVERLGRIFG